ncbi:MAG TPA: hypothetical protein V6C69_02565 [Trichormus sp.]|jgi:hypothetical protein
MSKDGSEKKNLVKKLVGLNELWNRVKNTRESTIDDHVDRLSQKLIETAAAKPELEQKLIAARKLAEVTNQMQALPKGYSASDCIQLLRKAMTKAHGKKAIAVERLAKLQVLHAQLIDDYTTTTHRQSATVAEAINDASDELHAASVHLFHHRPEEALKMADVAWLHIQFGRQVFDAETIEHLLGESDYLELCEMQVPIEKVIQRHFSELEGELAKFRDSLQESKAC